MNKRKHPTVPELALAFFKIGLTAYGMALLQQIKSLVIGKKWLSREEVDEGLAMTQLYPGPIIYNLVIYSSYRLKGFWGSLLTAFFFLLPSYMLMVTLSWIYFTYGAVNWVKPIFLVLEAMVIGIVLHILLDFGKRYIADAKSATLAGIAFLLSLFHFNALIIILLAVLLGIILNLFLKNSTDSNKKLTTGNTTHAIPGKLTDRLIGIIAMGIIFIFLLLIPLFSHTTNSQLLSSMFKIGAVAFGSGFTIMPLLQQEAVISHHWLTMQQFADGIAFGQITPGPFLITATFIGYKISGLWGSILATLGMFFPSFFYTLIITEIYDKIKTNKLIKSAIRDVMSAFTGMLAWVALNLGQVSLKNPTLYIWAVGSFILVRYFKVNILWIFVAGIAAEVGVYLLTT